MCPHIVGGHLDNLFELSINYEKNQIDLILYIYIYSILMIFIQNKLLKYYFWVCDSICFYLNVAWYKILLIHTFYSNLYIVGGMGECIESLS
jgi:hypothetical protein